MDKRLVYRTDLGPDCLRRLAQTSDTDRQRRRLLAVAALLEGAGRAEAAAAGQMTWQTLRDWVKRYNAKGVGGLRDHRRARVSFKLSAAECAEFARLVAGVPQSQADTPAGRGWTRRELVELCWIRFGVRYSERGISRLLERMGLAHRSRRPRLAPPAGREAAPRQPAPRVASAGGEGRLAGAPA